MVAGEAEEAGIKVVFVVVALQGLEVVVDMVRRAKMGTKAFLA